MNKEKIKEKIYALMKNRLKRLGMNTSDVDEYSSLLGQGIYDSMAFIELISEIEKCFDIEIDFEEMDASDFLSVNQIVNIIYDNVN